jgi:hypothetical protein
MRHISPLLHLTLCLYLLVSSICAKIDGDAAWWLDNDGIKSWREEEAIMPIGSCDNEG